MDLSLNYLLIWFIGILTASSAYVAWKAVRTVPAAIFLPAGVTGLCLFIAPHLAGYAGLVAWLLSSVLPQQILKRCFVLAKNGDRKAAIRHLKALAILAPSPDWGQLSEVLKAPPPIGLTSLDYSWKTIAAQQIVLALLASEESWSDLKQAIYDDKALLQGGEIRILFAQSLAETGDLPAFDKLIRHILSSSKLSSSIREQATHLRMKYRGTAPSRLENQLRIKPALQTGVRGLLIFTSLVYALQVATGFAISPDFSLELGALVPLLVTDFGQWWRIASCIFLHASLLHLAANMFGLYVLGVPLERDLGTSRFVQLYLLCGLGSSLFVVALTSLGILEQAYLVGASGAVLGLVGASAGRILLDWMNTQSTKASQELGSVLFILGIQTAFDLSTPQVSFPAHAGGVISGLALSLLPYFRKSPARSSETTN